MRKQKFLLIFITALLLSLVAYLFLSKGSQLPKAQTLLASNQSELACYPKRYAKPQQLNKFPFGGVVYYEVQAVAKTEPSDLFVEILYFSTSPKGCKWLNPDSQVGSRLLYMPKPVALHFAKLQYQPAFEQCLKQHAQNPHPKQHCIKTFEADINVPSELMSEANSFLYPEEVEILHQLGIKTDKALVITKPSDLDAARRKELEQP